MVRFVAEHDQVDNMSATCSIHSFPGAEVWVGKLGIAVARVGETT
jgi:hypothetical protein